MVLVKQQFSIKNNFLMILMLAELPKNIDSSKTLEFDNLGKKTRGFKQLLYLINKILYYLDLISLDITLLN